MLLIMYGGYMFDYVPLSVNQWLMIVLLASTIIPVDMLRKVITRKVL